MGSLCSGIAILSRYVDLTSRRPNEKEEHDGDTTKGN